MKIERKKLKRKKQLPSDNGKNYINNKEFLNEILLYKKELKELEELGDSSNTRLPVSDSLARYFLQIAYNLSNKANFLNYTFKDDMISDGVENCIQYVYNFDPAKSTNPFSYFTQIIFFAFVRRIKKEKKQMYIKYKSFLESELSDNEEIIEMIKKNDCLRDYKREFILNYEKSVDKNHDTPKNILKKESIYFFFDDE